VKRRLSVLIPSQGYMGRIAQGLDGVMGRAEAHNPCIGRTTFDLGTGRMIVLSDVHRGARNAADEFRVAERAYRAALAYYLRLGYTLVLLGDAEELWEERPLAVLTSYRETDDLEAEYHRLGRYWRIWGNHDDEWQYPERVEELLQPIYGGDPLCTYEGLMVRVMEDGAALGELFLVHGHQGDRKADHWSPISRLVIRYLWRPYQRLTHARVNTPATNWDLRYKLNRAMYAWAEQQSKLVLVAGHTHNPVFRSRSLAAQIELRLAALEQEAGAAPSAAQLEEQAQLLASLEWVRTEAQEAQRESDGIAFDKPCYFNTGCCCYDDGDITALELADGEIRLVRWPDADGEARPAILERTALRDVLEAL
jgi:hypothetical protein